MHRITASAALVVLFALAPSGAAAATPPGHAVSDVRLTKGIVYGRGETAAPPNRLDLLLDLYEPVTRSNGRRPAVVLIHRIPGGQHGFGGTGFFTREVALGQTAFDRMLDFARDALHPGQG